MEGRSTASELIDEMTNTEAFVSIANPGLELDQDHTACMIPEGPKNYNEAVRKITRARGAKDTNQLKTAAVGEESIIKENTASEKASTAGKKTCTYPSRRFSGISKKTSKADRCSTRSGGAKNTDRKSTTTVNRESTLIEKEASKETSTPEKNTKRKLTYVSKLLDRYTTFSLPSFLFFFAKFLTSFLIKICYH